MGTKTVENVEKSKSSSKTKESHPHTKKCVTQAPQRTKTKLAYASTFSGEGAPNTRFFTDAVGPCENGPLFLREVKRVQIHSAPTYSCVENNS